MARGPAAIQRGARPSDMAASMAAASATPCSSMCRHSRSTANWIRFQMKPGTSADTSGALPIRAARSRRAPTAASSVAGPATPATPAGRWAGVRKWRPARRPGWARASARSAIRRLEVLDATTASGASQGSTRRSRSRLASRSSLIVSTTSSAPARAPASIPAARIAAASAPSATARAAASAARPRSRPARVARWPAAASATASSGAIAPVPSTTAVMRGCLPPGGAPRGSSRRPRAPMEFCPVPVPQP